MDTNPQKTEFGSIFIENGIVIIVYEDGIEIDIEMARKIVAARLELIKETPMPNLVDSRGVKNISKEARDYLGSKEGTEGVTAGALVARSGFSILLINFFLKISRPVVPAQMFTSKQLAMAWLGKYK